MTRDKYLLAMAAFFIGASFGLSFSLIDPLAMRVPPTAMVTRTALPSRTPEPTRACPTLLYKPLPDGEGIEDSLVLIYDYAGLAQSILLHKLSQAPGLSDPDLQSAIFWLESLLFEADEAHSKVVTWIQLGALTCPVDAGG